MTGTVALVALVLVAYLAGRCAAVGRHHSRQMAARPRSWIEQAVWPE